jgi:hypothetical protein
LASRNLDPDDRIQKILLRIYDPEDKNPQHLIKEIPLRRFDQEDTIIRRLDPNDRNIGSKRLNPED